MSPDLGRCEGATSQIGGSGAAKWAGAGMPTQAARSSAMSELNYVGKSMRRKDGPDKVTGKAVYTQDVRLPNTLIGRLLRSPHPHARIVRIDTTRARTLPGVKAVIT